jgi:hypothetical protein
MEFGIINWIRMVQKHTHLCNLISICRTYIYVHIETSCMHKHKLVTCNVTRKFTTLILNDLNLYLSARTIVHSFPYLIKYNLTARLKTHTSWESASYGILLLIYSTHCKLVKLFHLSGSS